MGLTELSWVERTPDLTDKASVEPAALQSAPGRVTLVEHPRVHVTRVEYGFEFGTDRRTRVDQREDILHVFVEEGQRHGRIERVDRGRERLTSPNRSDERFTFGGLSAISKTDSQTSRELTVKKLLVEFRQFSVKATSQLFAVSVQCGERDSLVRLLRVGDQKAIDDAFAEQLTHDVPQETLNDDAQPGIIEPHLTQADQER